MKLRVRRTWLFHPPCHVPHGWGQTHRYNLLQETGLTAFWEMGPALQLHPSLVEVQTLFHPPTLLDTVHSRSPVCRRSCIKTCDATHRSSGSGGRLWHLDVGGNLSHPFVLYCTLLSQICNYKVYTLYFHYAFCYTFMFIPFFSVQFKYFLPCEKKWISLLTTHWLLRLHAVNLLSYESSALGVRCSEFRILIRFTSTASALPHV